MITPLLHGERIRLTRLQKDDLPLIGGWYHDSRFVRLYEAPVAVPRSSEQWEDWLHNIHRDKSSYSFAVRHLNSEPIIGLVEVESILWNHGVGWVSLAIGRESDRGQGYGAEAMRLLLKFAFHELNLHRLQLTVFAYNTPAIRLYEKLGFVREGAFREFVHRDGQRHDMLLYGLLRPEWEANQPG